MLKSLVMDIVKANYHYDKASIIKKLQHIKLVLFRTNKEHKSTLVKHYGIFKTLSLLNSENEMMLMITIIFPIFFERRYCQIRNT